ncbi:MAG: alpha-D-ribose 1-methylphosphonate 5-triphosphate diphosphatase [Rhodobacteraceae bacterium]|nr:alpha-D-ribose 1-methylphosphonate 5-triphosphate diphosphatase [Paracoccaceae bacterium]
MQRDLTFTGGQVLGAQCLAPADLSVRDGCFENGPEGPDGRTIDVSGLWLLPGIVDLHGDGFERHLAPRRGVMTDLAKGLESVEAELATCGITTGWLAQFWSWEGSMRGPGFATRLAEALTGSQSARRLDLRMQLRLESHMVEDGDAVRALIATHGIDYLVINDHLPHARLAEGRTPPRLTGSALKAGRSPEAHLAEMQYRAAQGPKVAGFVEALARDLAPQGVRLGTHDDPDAETRARHAAQGFDICEFPTTRAAAEAAHAEGAQVIMGAPNVLRGGSHGKGVAAEALIADGLVDALVSDYHYPSLVGAALALTDRGTLGFAEAWALISSRPAALLGLADRGQIVAGARADLVVFDPAGRRILGCFAAGRPAYLTGALADALLS